MFRFAEFTRRHEWFRICCRKVSQQVSPHTAIIKIFQFVKGIWWYCGYLSSGWIRWNSEFETIRSKMHLKCVSGAFTPVLRAVHLWSDHSGRRIISRLTLYLSANIRGNVSSSLKWTESQIRCGRTLMQCVSTQLSFVLLPRLLYKSNRRYSRALLRRWDHGKFNNLTCGQSDTDEE